MKLSDVINSNWLDAAALKDAYASAAPFPHIVMKNFINEDLLKKVVAEFPDLSKLTSPYLNFKDSLQIKLASKGMEVLSPAALHLSLYLQSDLFLAWLNTLTSIDEPLISDPYLAGGGYHEIKPGGLLKVHADFNKHPKLDLDRRLNLLIYLNEDWQEEWNGALQLFDESMATAVQTVFPKFNTAVIFTTTSYTYHGHPDPLMCPAGRSRKSLAYYYFSTGRPAGEVSEKIHTTLFRERKGEKFETKLSLRSVVLDIVPPIIVKAIRRIRK